MELLENNNTYSKNRTEEQGKVCNQASVLWWAEQSKLSNNTEQSELCTDFPDEIIIINILIHSIFAISVIIDRQLSQIYDLHATFKMTIQANAERQYAERNVLLRTTWLLGDILEDNGFFTSRLLD